MPMQQFAKAMKDFLAELNSVERLGLAVHPLFSDVILSDENTNIGYKLHREGDPSKRVMSLAVNLDAFSLARDGSMHLNEAAKRDHCCPKQRKPVTRFAENRRIGEAFGGYSSGGLRLETFLPVQVMPAPG